MIFPLDQFPEKARGFLSFPNQIHMLEDELRGRFNISDENIAKAFRHGELLVMDEALFPEIVCNRELLDKKELPFWSKVTWLDPKIITFDSIGQGANKLKEMQRSWASYSINCFRRSALIQEKLPYVNLKKRVFPVAIHRSPMGIFSLLDNNSMIASEKTSSLFPCGSLEFVEDHENPPSRAYLKFQEALVNFDILYGCIPESGNKCLDAGACPGGWTWVLRQLGCDVVAIDRTELANFLMKDSFVKFIKHDAFTIPPEELGHFHWVCSDVICYPERLLKWVWRWIESGLCDNMVCTIKMQGKTDWSLIGEFENIPNSRILHLNYNKHELTWLYHRERI
ncbi:MAG: SAM-dependent methyltransferase [Spirochaetaceae bacterium]|nr:SAM-dependent methyltransferase [Spirochaetaceae bacterium]